MSPQTEAVYDWMIKKGKKLSLPITCRLCKKPKSKSEYNTSTAICKACWNSYVKMTKREKKELLHDSRKV